MYLPEHLKKYYTSRAVFQSAQLCSQQLRTRSGFLLASLSSGDFPPDSELSQSVPPAHPQAAPLHPRCSMCLLFHACVEITVAFHTDCQVNKLCCEKLLSSNIKYWFLHCAFPLFLHHILLERHDTRSYNLGRQQLPAVFMADGRKQKQIDICVFCQPERAQRHICMTGESRVDVTGSVCSPWLLTLLFPLTQGLGWGYRAPRSGSVCAWGKLSCENFIPAQSAKAQAQPNKCSTCRSLLVSVLGLRLNLNLRASALRVRYRRLGFRPGLDRYLTNGESIWERKRSRGVWCEQHWTLCKQD